jgi:hypothetical protein
MGATGTATLNFGAAPGTNTATATVTGQTGILSNSVAEAWFMGVDSTADHNAYEHMIMPLAVTLSVTSVSSGSGFVISASTQLRLTGQVSCRWVWN